MDRDERRCLVSRSKHQRTRRPTPGKGYGHSPDTCGRCGAKDPATWTGPTGWICDSCLKKIEESEAMKLDATQATQAALTVPTPDNPPGWDALLGIGERTKTEASASEPAEATQSEPEPTPAANTSEEPFAEQTTGVEATPTGEAEER